MSPRISVARLFPLASRWVLICLPLLAGGVLGLSAQPVDDAIAKMFYPASLEAEFRDNHAPGVELFRTYSATRINAQPGGPEDYLAVAYYNGLASSLRVIHGTSLADAVLVVEEPDATMGGRGQPVIEAVDIDNDQVPELAVAFFRATWIYKFRNGALTLFCPTRVNDPGLTCLGEVAYTEIDGDGKLEIVDVSQGDSDGYRMYGVDESGAIVRLSTTAIFSDRFEGGSTVTRRFAATPGVDYVMRIINGDQLRQDPAATAAIAVNGVSLVSPADISVSTRLHNVPIRLSNTNELTVHVTGETDSLVWITIVRTASAF